MGGVDVFPQTLAWSETVPANSTAEVTGSPVDQLAAGQRWNRF